MHGMHSIMKKLVLSLLLAAGVLSAVAQNVGRVAYVSNGNLYVRTLPTGRTEQLTRGGGTVAPRWSPSGDWVAYLDNDRLTVQRATGGRERVISGGDVAATDRDYAWSPREDQLAFVGRNAGLYLATPGAQRVRELVRGRPGQNQEQVTDFAWSPDGRWLTYTLYSVTPTPGSASSQRVASIWRIDADGSHARRLIAYGATAFQPRRPMISPDGRWIVYWRIPQGSSSIEVDGTPLYALPVSGGASRQVMPSVLGFREMVTFSPTGRWLVAAQGAGRETWLNKRLAKVEFATGLQRFLTPTNQATLFPDWSPDGDTIVYTSGPVVDDRDNERDNLRQRRIRLVDEDGGRIRQLTNDRNYRDEFPRWSADGNRILFVRVDERNRASLWLMRPDGSSLTRVSETLGLARNDNTNWGGFYGLVTWTDYFDWWEEED